MSEDILTALLGAIESEPAWFVAILLFIIGLYFIAKIGNPIIDFWKKLNRRLFRSKKAAEFPGNPEVARLQAIRDGLISPDQAIELAYAEAGRR